MTQRFRLNYAVELTDLKTVCEHTAGFPRALEIMKNLKNQEESFMHGKIMEFNFFLIIMENSWNFVK